MKFIDAINNVDTSDTGKFHTPELQEVVVELFGSEGWNWELGTRPFKIL